MKPPRSNRRGQKSAAHTPIGTSRKVRWEKWKRRVRAGLLLIPLALPGNAERPVRAYVGLGEHLSQADGFLHQQKMRELGTKRRLGLVAVENANATRAKCVEIEQGFERGRVEFRKWRARAHPSKSEIERMAQQTARELGADEFLTPILAETLIQDIPFKFVEGYTPEESTYGRVLQSKTDSFDSRIAQSLAQGKIEDAMRLASEQSASYRTLLDFRNARIQEGMRQLTHGIYGKDIYVVVGGLHLDVSNLPFAEGITLSHTHDFRAKQIIRRADPEEAGARQVLYVFLQGVANSPNGSSFRGEVNRATDRLENASLSLCLSIARKITGKSVDQQARMVMDELNK